MTELAYELRQSIIMAKSKSKIPIVDGSVPILSKEEANVIHTQTRDRLRVFKESHDLLEFGAEARINWVLLAFQELVRDAWPFMNAVRGQMDGVRKEVCEEWLAVHARLMRKGPAE